ncbi:MAG TPA: hypothetical protein VIO61_02895 [Anaerolineaceae bacterium]
MQQYAEHVFIETSYPGVTLAAIPWSHGLIMIDAPFRADDVRTWRSALLNLGGGVERLLVSLDAHFDRTLGVRAMDCTTIGHEKMANVFRNRPVTFKSQSSETGAEWEQYNGLGNIRWSPPEITFSQKMQIQWDESPLELEYHPGVAAGAIWAILPEQKILLAGDAVIVDQPPFVGSADLPTWLDQLELLLAPPLNEYLVISGRGGAVTHPQIRTLYERLKSINQHLENLAEQKAPAEETSSLVKLFLAEFDIPAGRQAQYTQRLHYGLHHYYIRHFQSAGEDIVE